MLYEKSCESEKERLALKLDINKLKLKGHGSFYLREGWLRKGILGISKEPTFFSRKDAVDILGVGSNMVSAIKYYLLATGLIEESESKNRKKTYILSKGFGEIIFKCDEYFEDIFSLWLLHYKIAKNADFATSWYMFYNGMDRREVSKNDLMSILEDIIEKNLGEIKYSRKSLNDDINCIIKSYINIEYTDKTPEENLMCPFSELELLKEGNNLTGEKVLFKSKPYINKLNKLVILYVIADNCENGKNVSIDSILGQPGNAGKIFNLDRPLVNQYLDLLKEEDLIDINKTAGLDQVYIKLNDTEEILKYYYENEGNTNA